MHIYTIVWYYLGRTFTKIKIADKDIADRTCAALNAKSTSIEYIVESTFVHDSVDDVEEQLGIKI